MKEYRLKMGENGRIVIPAFFRKELRIEPGEELVARMENHELHLVSSKQAIKDAQKRIRALTKGTSLVKKLKAMRNEDNNND